MLDDLTSTHPFQLASAERQSHPSKTGQPNVSSPSGSRVGKRAPWKAAEDYSRTELHALINRLKQRNEDAIQEAVAFTMAESRGIWHGRARAKICRNLKNMSIDRGLQKSLVQRIGNRLTEGRFSEQFKDQLTMAIRFRPEEMRQHVVVAAKSDKDYVQRYATWVANKIEANRLNT